MKSEENRTSTWLNQYERGKIEIGIFELAELLGITPEALRKYEEKEIIQPIRDERGYRKFHSWDLTKIICARRMRLEGFALNDVADNIRNNDAQNQMDRLEEMKKKLMQEILYRQKLIQWLSSQKDEVMRCEQAGTQCVIERLPLLYCCVYMVDNTLVNKKGKALEHLKKWLQAMPFVSVFYIGSPKGKMLSCLVMTEEERHGYNLESLVPDFVVPEQCYVVSYTTAEHDSEHDTSEDSILAALHRAEEMRMKLDGYVVGRMIRYVQHAETYASVNKMCFPVAEK